jgi:plasmid stabilization system protein ParE
MKVLIAKSAEDDFADIANWIARDSPTAARRVVRELRRNCADLGRFPNRFPKLHPESQFRRRVAAPYVIIYTVEDAVIIARVLHGARDYAALFAGREDPDAP